MPCLLHILIAATLIPLHALFDMPAQADTKVSPDGRWLLSQRSVGGRPNLFVRPVSGGSWRQITPDDFDPIGATGIFVWTPDSQSVLLLHDRNGNEITHLYRVSLQPAVRPVDLTPYNGVTMELVAVPNSKVAVITLNRRVPTLADAYRVDLRTGALTLAAQNRGNFIGYLADRAGRVRLAYAMTARGAYEIYTRPNEATRWSKVRTVPPSDAIDFVAFTRDGSGAYVLSSEGGDFKRLQLLNLHNGDLSALEADPLRSVDIDSVLLSRNNDVIGTRYVGDAGTRWYARTGGLKRLLAHGGLNHVNLDIISASDDSRWWTYMVDAPEQPPALFLFDSRTNHIANLSDSRPALSRYALAATAAVRFRARDGFALRGYLTRVDTTRHPLVVLVHGGPWSRDIWSFDETVQFLANRGYTVLQVNYRGSTGFGKTYANAARKQFARKMETDLLDGIAFANARGYSNGNVAIMGGSYGGYATLVGLTMYGSAFRCGVDLAGPADLVTLMESFPPDWKPFLPRRWYPFVGNPAIPADRRDLIARSPLFHADSATAPLFIFQGQNDPRVTRAQSDRIAAAFRKKGLPVTYLVANDSGHSFGSQATSLAVNLGIERFLSKCLNGMTDTRVDANVEDALRNMMVP
jgi:dipeptidyl aminopeptidase/acylaminoacyl peptidase